MKTSNKKSTASEPSGFINVPVSDVTREGLLLLKEAMAAKNQAEVIERLVAIGVAIHHATSR